MDSSQKTSSKECDIMFRAGTGKYRVSRGKSSSFSSSSSLSSFSSNNSPATLLQFSGVPFSWEYLPGIPKNQSPMKDFSLKFLPLPPHTIPPPTTTKKSSIKDQIRKNISGQSESDPFFAAFVECSKDQDIDDDLHHRPRLNSNYNSYFRNGVKISSRSSTKSDGIGIFSVYTSCNRSCDVSESIVYLPVRASRSRTRSKQDKLINLL